MTSGVWEARYPDLAGKVAIVSGDGALVPAIVEVLAANGTATAVVARTKSAVDAAVSAAEARGIPVIGVVADPCDERTWARVLPHAEQRLGPIDLLVTLGVDTDRHAAVLATRSDMGARRRGVVVEVGEPGDLLPLPEDLRHRVVTTVNDADAAAIAAAVAFCASDVLTVPVTQVTLGT